MLDPLISTIEVPCGQEKAFGVFVSEMGSWWPLDKRSMSLMHGGKPAKSLRIDPKLGEVWRDIRLPWTLSQYTQQLALGFEYEIADPEDKERSEISLSKGELQAEDVEHLSDEEVERLLNEMLSVDNTQKREML